MSFRRLGLLGWIRSIFFGYREPRCAREGCSSLRDPRCAGGNCTEHCESVNGCKGICVKIHSARKLCLEVARLGHRLDWCVDGGVHPGGSMDSGYLADRIRCVRCGLIVTYADDADPGEVLQHFLEAGDCDTHSVRGVMES